MKTFLLFTCMIVISFQAPCQVTPVLTWIGQYLLGKAVDGVWSYTTSAPDIGTLDTRLKNLEASLDESLRKPISELRSQINENTTHAQYESFVRKTISSLQKQVDKNTEDIRVNTEDIRKNAEDIRKYSEYTRKNTEDLDVIKKKLADLEKSQQGIKPKGPDVKTYPLFYNDKPTAVRIHGKPRSIWSNGFIDISADHENYSHSLKPEERLDFLNCEIIHVMPKSRSATILYVKPLNR